MGHVKKSEMPRTWPVPRKGSTFIAVPSHATSKGISLLFLLRDVLKIAKTRKEARFMTLNGDVKVNNKVRKDENFPVQVFDVLSLDKAKLNYRLEIVNRKFSLKEISASDAGKKVVKISGKTTLGKDLVQINLEDGQNLITKEKFSVSDSVVLDTKANKISKILPLKEGANVEVISGKHAGEKGKLKGFEELVRGKNIVVKLEKGEVSLPLKTLLVIE
ncbi:30S ribosomal protein S4e [archaeon]|jgi:small subunit ribosomal protein S4e|nr:30S ribosomal protein S4e [archaeon]MBT3578260.1 30S ribosomal protein S4e [archaeon]MBT6819819.1 30S ribosomal protein S4e [archaeon]MBT6956605.1 30S ribosomal protein S4e [archaeon]MBT7025601.1 30S ribosomal protein S4e [archaeon]